MGCVDDCGFHSKQNRSKGIVKIFFMVITDKDIWPSLDTMAVTVWWVDWENRCIRVGRNLGVRVLTTLRHG